MSYHSSTEFEFGQPITEKLVQEIVDGLNQNKEYNKEDTGSDAYQCVYYVCI